jgi:hypothetical protein
MLMKVKVDHRKKKKEELTYAKTFLSVLGILMILKAKKKLFKKMSRKFEKNNV